MTPPPEASTPASPSAPREPRRSRGGRPGKGRRWFWWTVLVLAVLVLSAFVAAHLIVRSDLPRAWTIAALQKATGLRIQAAELQTGWLGGTRLRKVSVALPLEDEPFILLPALDLQHTSLLRIVLTRSVNFESVVLTEPQITLRRDQHGRWNLVQAIAVLQTALPAGTASEAGASGHPAVALPTVRIKDARVRVVLPGHDVVTVQPVTLEGQPEDVLTWSFTLEISSALKGTGRILSGSTWWHSLQVEAGDLSEYIRLLWPQAPTMSRLSATWEGQFKKGGIEGQAHIQDLELDDWSVEGTWALAIGSGRTVLKPRDAALTFESAFPSPMYLDGGSLRLEGDTIEVDHLDVRYRGFRAQATGTFHRSDRTGKALLTWVGRDEGVSLHHDGRVDRKSTRLNSSHAD